MSGKRYFGNVRRLSSGRFQARYTGPDGRSYSGPVTFDSKQYANAWLDRIHAEIQTGRWVSPLTPGVRPPTLRDYAAAWLADRDLKLTTRRHYRDVLDRHVLPTLGDALVTDITPAAVRTWHAALGRTAGPTIRSHAYRILRSILNTAVADDLIVANPCRIRGAGSDRRVKVIRPATLAELDALVAAMPERYRTMTLLAAWCGLRFGELTELRRSDVDLRTGVLRVRRGVVHLGAGQTLVSTPKTEAGIRDVAVPPHLLPAVREHVQGLTSDALLFPGRDGRHMAASSLQRVFGPARAKAGRPDLRWHDLRHTSAVLAAATGATLAELMSRLGHTTPGMAMRYQHAAQDRDRVIAEALSDLATKATVTPISLGQAR
jgi:integrase